MLVAEIFFRAYPFLLLGISYYVFWWFKRWVVVWDLSEGRLKKILLIYKILMVLFITPWLPVTVLGPGTHIIPPEWFKISLFYPAFVWHLVHLPLFIILSIYGFVNLVLYPVIRVYKRSRPAEKPDVEKRYWLKKSLIALPATLFTINTVGLISGEYDHVVTYQPIKISNWPENLKGFKITQISDIHFGPFMDDEKLAMFVKEVNNLKSDMILVTGDIINSSKDLIPRLTREMARLKAPHGVYACMGNHEHFSGPEILIKSFSEAGMPVLINEARLMNIRESEFYLMGVDYPSKSPFHEARDNAIKKQLDITLKNTDAEKAKILMAHHPDSFFEASNMNVDLTLSGHTHGGHFVFGEYNGKIISFSQIGYRYLKGYYERGGSQLYVNSGLGHWLPIRFNCPPEITQFILE